MRKTVPADVSIRWARSDIRQSSHNLWLDLEKECVHVSDGWGVAFAALRLWALDLSNGREKESCVF
ncbi:hypothetical protein [Lysinibacillus sp. NPDC093216]|uniref:hypothetical protein n=1 Tax=Lysinibacillus sp. NPDC093216 TaxID=3390576 RepID=UPI003D0779A5